MVSSIDPMQEINNDSYSIRKGEVWKSATHKACAIVMHHAKTGKESVVKENRFASAGQKLK